jgi:hypothetical protein
VFSYFGVRPALSSPKGGSATAFVQKTPRQNFSPSLFHSAAFTNSNIFDFSFARRGCILYLAL